MVDHSIFCPQVRQFFYCVCVHYLTFTYKTAEHLPKRGSLLQYGGGLSPWKWDVLNMDIGWSMRHVRQWNTVHFYRLCVLKKT